MKTPFLLLAAILSIHCAGPAFAADLAPFQPSPVFARPAPHAGPLAQASTASHRTSAKELQRRLDHADDALEDFRDSHPNRLAWTRAEKDEYHRLKARVTKAEEDLQVAEMPGLRPIGPHHEASRHMAKHETFIVKADRDLDKAWSHIEGAAVGVTDGIFDAFHMIKQGAEDAYVDGVDGARRVTHVRPMLFSNYIDVVKKGHEVSFIYCDSRLSKLNLMGGQHCEKLHAGSFNMAELHSCLNSAGENKQPGMILNRQLADSMGADRDFSVDHLKMFDSKENYSEYLNSCHARVAGNRPAMKRHPIARAVVPMPRARPASVAPALEKMDFPALDDQNIQAAPAPTAEGTL